MWLRVVAVVLAAAAVTLVAVAVVLRDDDGDAPDRGDCAEFVFDGRAWADWSRNPRSEPSRMKQARLIVTCETLVGVGRQRARVLLGAPDLSERRKAYWLVGVDPDFGVQPAYLIAEFDERGRVRRTRIA